MLLLARDVSTLDLPEISTLVRPEISALVLPDISTLVLPETSTPLGVSILARGSNVGKLPFINKLPRNSLVPNHGDESDPDA